MNRHTIFALALLLTAPLPAHGDGPPVLICGNALLRSPTLRQECREVDILVVGTLKNPRHLQDAEGNRVGSATDLDVESVLKGTDALGDRGTITIGHYIQTDDPERSNRFLIFCDVENGKLDPYKGMPIAEDELIPYIKVILNLGERTTPESLAVFLPYLSAEGTDVAGDAFLEFQETDHRVFAEFARGLDPKTVLAMLDGAPQNQVGLISLLLAHCGNRGHANTVLEHIDKTIAGEKFSGLDHLFVSHIMLDPEAGWDRLRAVLGDPDQAFLVRYHALRAARFLWETGSKIKTRDEIVAAVSLLLAQPDIADLPIHELREWRRWDVADDVFDLYDEEARDVRIVRRAILLFALSMPKNDPRAEGFLEQAREENPELVKDLAELLALQRQVGGRK